MNAQTTLGTVTVPDGSNGPWKIDTKVLTDDEIGLSNLRAIRDGFPEMVVTPGTYRILRHERQGIVMSNTRMEIITNREFILNAKGDVLVLGLGLGMVLEALLKKPGVTSITVIEISPELIELVGPHFTDERLTIIHADALTWQPPKGQRYGAVWCDIWATISAENYEDMKLLTRRYGRRADWVGCWSRELITRMNRRGW